MRRQLGLSIHEFTNNSNPGIAITVGYNFNYIRDSYPVTSEHGERNSQQIIIFPL